MVICPDVHFAAVDFLEKKNIYIYTWASLTDVYLYLYQSQLGRTTTSKLNDPLPFFSSFLFIDRQSLLAEEVSNSAPTSHASLTHMYIFIYSSNFLNPSSKITLPITSGNYWNATCKPHWHLFSLRESRADYFFN